MGLLEEIRGGAVDGHAELDQVLRKCLILAHRLRHEPFRAWVDQELNGYREHAAVPRYRTISVEVHYNAATPVSVITGRHHRLESFPQELWDEASSARVMQGVTELDALKDVKDLNFPVPWAVYNHLNKSTVYGATLTSVYQPIYPGTIKGILSAVRNRLVDFTLSIEEEFPDVNDRSVSTEPQETAKVDHIYQTIIEGHNHVINLGTNTIAVQQIAQRVIAGDLDSLRTFLESEGFAKGDLSGLDNALADSNAVEEAKENRGPLIAWADNAAKKLAKGAGGIIFETAKQLAIKAALQYAGMN